MILRRIEAYEKPLPGTNIMSYILEKPLDVQIQHRLWNSWLGETFTFVSGVIGYYGGFVVTGYNKTDVVEQTSMIAQEGASRGQEVVQLEEAHNEN